VIAGDIIKNLIAQAQRHGKFDDDAFVAAQSALPFESRETVRYAPDVARLYFGVDVPPGVASKYYFWDNTTLSLKAPLLALVADGARVLEIGPGSAATLSILLAKHRKNVRITCAEINREFIPTARAIAGYNEADLTIVESDMGSGIAGEFDAVFMNPPYVTVANLAKLNIDRRSHEGRSGDGGEDGCRVVAQFLREIPGLLRPDGVALLGVNTRHLGDDVVTDRITKSRFRLDRRWYPDAAVQPRGVHSQVYVLRRRD
jgi:methylase of polypeptide subunit release factors